MNRGCREFEPEFAADIAGIHADLSPHPFDRFSDDRQSHAGAGIGFLRMNALEQAKKAAVVFGLDPDAVILHAKPHPITVPFRVNQDGRNDSRGDEFDGVR